MDISLNLEGTLLRREGVDEHAVGAQRKPFGPCLHDIESQVSNDVKLLGKHRN